MTGPQPAEGGRAPYDGPAAADPCYSQVRMPDIRTITLGPNDSGRRLDRVVRKAFPALPLARVYSAIRAGDIRVNGRKRRKDFRVHDGDELQYAAALGATGGGRPAAPSPSPVPPIEHDEPLAARIVFQDSHLLVVNKRRGELVHGAGSLTTAVEQHLAGTLAPGVSFRPGPLHRLDRNTSGLIVFSASLLGAQAMSRALRSRRVIKRYVAVLGGTICEPCEWADALSRTADRRTRAAGAGRGQRAVTVVEPVAAAGRATGSDAAATLAIVRIVTGRTHQIRAQAAIHGHSLPGDRKYGGPPLPGGYLLHAGSLTVAAPEEGIGFDHLWAPLPVEAGRQIVTIFGKDALREAERIIARPPRD
jgi:23S rRNA pseudouridine955/2504/2580 synthase